MNGFAQVFQEMPLAAGFGAMGLFCQLTWPLFRARRRILSVQLGIGANYGAQYALLDAWSGAGVCCIGATQTGVALIAGDRPWLRRLGFVFIPVVGLLSWVTWCGLASFLAMSACCLVMIGRMQGDTLRMRCFLLAAAPFGIGYDVTVGAAPAFIGAVVSACIGAAALRREIRTRRADGRLPGGGRLSGAFSLLTSFVSRGLEERSVAA